MLQSKNIPMWWLWRINLALPCLCFRWIHSGCHWKYKCQSVDETCVASHSTGMRSTSWTCKEVYLPGWLLLGQYFGTTSSVSVSKWMTHKSLAIFTQPALVDDNSPRITELSGAIEMWLQEWKRLCRKMQMHLKPNCCVQHCAIALPGCATKNEQQNVGCRIWTILSLGLITSLWICV